MWADLIDKKIIGFRGYTNGNLHFILFDDKKSYLKLDRQDSYDYHDCNASARTITLHQNEKLWGNLFADWPVFTGNTTDPF